MSSDHYRGVEPEITSEFSYTESDAKFNPEDTESQYSSQYSSSYTAPFAPPGKAPFTTKTTGNPNYRESFGGARDSYMSSFTTYSGHKVAEPVSVTRVNEPIVPTVNRGASIKRDRKLETSPGQPDRLEPDMSYNTSVEGLIPPRSSRRPKSEIVDKQGLEKEVEAYINKRASTGTTRPPRGHKVSLSISDELDKLLERANSVRLKTYTFEELSEDSSLNKEHIESKESLNRPEDVRLNSNESFKTASVHSSEKSESETTPMLLPKGLPPRPSQDNLARARQASSQIEKESTGNRSLEISVASKDRIHQTLPQPPVTDDDESHYSDDPLITGTSLLSRGSSNLSRGLGIAPPVHSERYDHTERYDHSPSHQSLQVSQPFERDLSPMKPQNVYDDENSSSNYNPLEYEEKGVEEESTPYTNIPSSSYVTASGTGESGEVASQPSLEDATKNIPEKPTEEIEQDNDDHKVAIGTAVGALGAVGAASMLKEKDEQLVEETAVPEDHDEPADETHNSDNSRLDDSHNTTTSETPVLAQNKRSSGQYKTPDATTTPVEQPPAPAPTHTEGALDLDDQYYDIDDPVVVEKPARGKSVKESTKHPKNIKRKTSKKKKSKDGLKPFSYHTLINLLESINGTIIGEEFNQLNLPVKEKQLIEKIVDQLSRLTLDMVLDEQRYAIGIDRLERALRVLEGFM